MLKKDLNLRSPIEKIMGIDNIAQTRFGAVLSRAGVGKTRFLVQIALTRLLQDQKSFMSVSTIPLEKSICATMKAIPTWWTVSGMSILRKRSGYGMISVSTK